MTDVLAATVVAFGSALVAQLLLDTFGGFYIGIFLISVLAFAYQARAVYVVLALCVSVWLLHFTSLLSTACAFSVLLQCHVELLRKSQHCSFSLPSCSSVFEVLAGAVVWAATFQLFQPSTLTIICSVVCSYAGYWLNDWLATNSLLWNRQLKATLPPQSLSNFQIENLEGVAFAPIVTGCTGLVGGLLLKQLLHSASETNLTQVFIMLRPSKKETVQQRLEALKQDIIGDDALLAGHWDSMVVAVAMTDMTSLDGLQLPAEDIEQLQPATHLLHCAASVNFNDPIVTAARINIQGALNMAALAAQLPHCTRFVHVSTAYIHVAARNTDRLIKEQSQPDLKGRDPQALFDAMLADSPQAHAVMKDLDFPNTYTFSKCIGEYLMQQYTAKQGVCAFLSLCTVSFQYLLLLPVQSNLAALLDADSFACDRPGAESCEACDCWAVVRVSIPGLAWL